LLRFGRRRSWKPRRDHLTILMYHGILEAPLPIPHPCFVEAGRLRGQLETLSRLFSIRPLEEAVAALQAGEIDRPTAAVTFDDGFQSTFDVAHPILQHLGIPATVFLVTDLLDTEESVWFCKLNRAIAEARGGRLDWRGRCFEFSDRASRRRAIARLEELLKTLPQTELLAEVDSIVEGLGQDPTRGFGPGSPFRILGRSAVTEMLEGGLVELGAHTASHAILSGLSPERQRREIEDSLAAVTEVGGRACSLFAYPNGRSVDYGAPSRRLLRELGVTAAVTTEAGLNLAETPPLELRRHGQGLFDEPASLDRLLEGGLAWQ
jgi:peptidoglycan/xylan/chitin deacetylase (PgdA/CDA1 family)